MNMDSCYFVLMNCRKDTLMKVMMVTDSLGAVRDEYDVEITWTYKIMDYFSGAKGVVFFSDIVPGRSIRSIDTSYLANIKPDIVFYQVGIVDCLRRAEPNGVRLLLQKIPFSNHIKTFLSENHYLVTKIFDWHISSKTQFSKAICKLDEIGLNSYFIRIADSGGGVKG